MYSSNPPPFSQLTSSSSSTTLGHANFFPHHSLHEIFLPPNNHLQDPFSDFYNLFPPNNAGPSPMTTFIDSTATATAVLADQELHHDSVRAGLQLKKDHLYPHCDPLGYRIATKKSTRAKTDRHTMIFTAQGLRHRRVRLSTDIAQKFFNLQDMLGFDKASQTLDWLFTNSKTDIQQLLELHNLSNSSSSTSECELLDTSKLGAAELSEGSQRAMLNSKNKQAFIRTSGKEKRSRAAHTDKLAKESREKARTRARERTLEKQRIGKLNVISSASSEIVMPSLSTEAPWKDIIVDAILTKKPLKSSSSIYVYQQNMPVPEEIKFQSQLFSPY